MHYRRRYFLQGMAATTITLGACGLADQAPKFEFARAIDPKTLEKPKLVVGFVPVNDCAPFAIAWQKGLFYKYGLDVILSREASWANARDGLIFGRLDAAPVVVGTITNARLGAEGARPIPLCAAMTIHRHGNGITMGRPLWQGGLRPLQEYQGNLEQFGRELRQYFAQHQQQVWGVVLSAAVYEYLLRYILAVAGIDPRKQARIIINPPPQMVNGLRIGSMQGYMVAEPWNTRAISDQVSFTFAQGREIWRGHPDRVLGVTQAFLEQNPKTYRSLVKAMIEACRYCSDPQNRPEVARLITEPAFTGARVPGLAIDTLTRPGIVGEYNYGGFDGQTRLENQLETTLFFDLPADLKDDPADHSTFLWHSQGIWLMTQAARWGQVREFPRDAEAIVKQSWRSDLYRDIAAELGIDCPREDYKLEPAGRFFDQRGFDPGDPIGYLKSFNY